MHIALYVFIIGVLWWGSFGYGMYLIQAGMGGGDRRLLKRGRRGTAVVLKATATGTTIGGQPDFGYFGRRVYRYQLRVCPPEGRPYETYCSVAAGGLSEGQSVKVAIARHNRKRVMIDLGQDKKTPKGKKVQPEVPRQAMYAHSKPTVQDAVPPRHLNPNASSEAHDRLRQLKELGQLHQEGVLTDEEFSAEKARILKRES
ncbi:SHOCT domain-containing protein [Streptacidiphilus sp. MAP12-20]|uniref:SHOCT domain-containing protein n=1 Tax=Streptacidiphilus sp. MAP12-20 TaxID=3156299 RepID=UPI0035197CC3